MNNTGIIGQALVANPGTDWHPVTDCWHGVRRSASRRTVWCGPALAKVVSGLDLVPFVFDLLDQREPALAARYRRCDSE